MILIISDSNDFSTHEVCKWFNYYDHKFVLLNDLSVITDIHFNLNNNKKECIITINNNETFNLFNIFSVWHRRSLISFCEGFYKFELIKIESFNTPIAGKVTFTKFWNENQDIIAGENVLTVIPEKPEKLTGKLQLPVAGSGKVKIGQKVNIKLENYPYLEYGTLVGTVENISLVAIENNYFVEIDLPSGLTTNYNKTLPFSSQLQGSAEIITVDIRLIERFLQPLKTMFKQHVES